MKTLKFKRMLLVSSFTKCANQFEFPKKHILITGDDNSIGKSTLVKNIFWGLGCEPVLDDNWISLGCKVLLDFSIENDDYTVAREGNIIFFGKKHEKLKKYTKISGEYSQTLADLLGFKVKLINRSDDNPDLETPPPAYYFLPFYIDQKKSWSAAWDSFNNLSQYARWQQKIIKYHTGYLSPDYFNLEEDAFEIEKKNKKISDDIQRIDTAIDVVDQYSKGVGIPITEEDLKLEIDKAETVLIPLLTNQKESLEALAHLKTRKFDLENQLNFAQSVAVELDKDYTFTVENIHGDVLECPLCGVQHDNTLVSRASILHDVQEIHDQATEIINDIKYVDADIARISKEIELTTSEVELYLNSDTETTEGFKKGLLDIISSSIVKINVKATKTAKQAEHDKNSALQKSINKEKNKLTTKEYKAELDAFFCGSLSKSIRDLDASAVNLNKIKSPTDHKKIFQSGGAAESTRAALAYHVAIINQINKANNEVISPFVIDTPNQQEQALKNYDRIVTVINTDLPDGLQIFLCGMHNSSLDSFEKNAHVITLNKGRLLSPVDFKKIESEYLYLTKQ
ncbi:hypothetical protein [Aeromonas sp. 1HA1]|uniref:hypothetical protein n=1 Tax=Aeromonas sp. 1HA1 TaxID=2699193 RepID=UPI0023DE0DE7|nr:hypothetical protein [Aeromonas sp. 1HA1]MDF2413939.1 hypothetical protein [Aeromonas sp. 1HA1]